MGFNACGAWKTDVMWGRYRMTLFEQFSILKWLFAQSSGLKIYRQWGSVIIKYSIKLYKKLLPSFPLRVPSTNQIIPSYMHVIANFLMKNKVPIKSPEQSKYRKIHHYFRNWKMTKSVRLYVVLLDGLCEQPMCRGKGFLEVVFCSPKNYHIKGIFIWLGKTTCHCSSCKKRLMQYLCFMYFIDM